ncbi:MAG TPA: hypothetical protein VMW28_09565 [Pelolinea sp.]|nr:hypothetical protein [Pelolinea sp.]
MSGVICNPDNGELKKLVGQMPNAVKTEWGNLCVCTRVTARISQYTFFVSDEKIFRPAGGITEG